VTATRSGGPGRALSSAPLPRLLYLDTSAIAKRYIAESGSRTVRTAMNAAPARATSIVAYAEMRSALIRARRDGRLTSAAYATAISLLSAHWPHYLRLIADDACTLEAGRLVEAHSNHALRGFDAIHLASAHRLAAGQPASVTFACWDTRLWRAARDDGFHMLPSREP
jgi:uncharacterized protein